jgi:hypothetical protein
MQAVNDFWLHHFWYSPGAAAWTILGLAGCGTALAIRFMGQSIRPASQPQEYMATVTAATAVNTGGILGALLITNVLLGAIAGVLLFGAMR